MLDSELGALNSAFRGLRTPDSELRVLNRFKLPFLAELILKTWGLEVHALGRCSGGGRSPVFHVCQPPGGDLNF